MPGLRTYKLFISHSWSYNDDYYRLVDYLNDAPNFEWQNLSVPEHDPISDADLRRQLRKQIKPASSVLILAGMYTNHSEAIQLEINLAESYNKPIIGIRPWGNKRTPRAVKRAAKEMVGWNTSSIVNAVRRHGR